MRYIRTSVLVALAAASTACAWRRTPVPVITDGSSIEALVGDWSGDYKSNDTGRSGTISFQLASARDTAYGDVMMVPRSQNTVTGNEARPAVITPPQAAAQPLTIRFVRMDGGLVSGTLAPYSDPECGCRVVTTFEGKFTGINTIEGTFTTRGTSIGHVPAAGLWKVSRQTSPRSN